MDSIIPQTTPMRQCTGCKKWFPATSDFFNKYIHARSGKVSLKSKCVPCERALKRAKYHEKHPPKGKEEKEVLEEGYRRCRKCEQILPITNFSLSNDRADKLQTWCKDCWKQYRADHIEQERVWRQNYRETFKKEIRERRHRRYQEAGRFVYEANKEKISQHRKVFYGTPEGVLKRKIGKHRRRMRLLGIEGRITTNQIAYKLKAQKYACYYCFVKFEKRKGRYRYHMDHVIPITRTEAVPKHDVNYIVLTCAHCNVTKHAKLLSEWPEGGRLF